MEEGRKTYCANCDDKSQRGWSVENIVPVDEVNGYEPREDSGAELNDTKEENKLDQNPVFAGQRHTE